MHLLSCPTILLFLISKINTSIPTIPFFVKGTHGTAYTLLTYKDKEFAGHIVKNVEAAKQEVPQDVLDLALQSSWFKKQR